MLRVSVKGGRVKYGWIPDLPDHRDRYYSPPVSFAPLPPSTDLRPRCPPVYDQGTIGSCTANALAAAYQFDNPSFLPSRLFLYYEERTLEGTTDVDTGAMLRDGMKVLATLGVCPETLWPYNLPFQLKPNNAAYAEALHHRAIEYQRLAQTLLAMRSCLAAGYPFVFGFTVYEDFESERVANTGVLEIPDPSEGLLGGHAVMAVGYNDASQRFLVRNSWGSQWGLEGYFTVPYAYMTDPNLADDFWTIRRVAA